MEKHSYLHILLHQFTKKHKLDLKDISRFLMTLLDKYDDEKSTPQKPLLKALKSSYHESETDDDDKTTFKKPYKQLLIWAILMNR